MTSLEQLRGMEYFEIEYQVLEVIRRWNLRSRDHMVMAATHERWWKLHQPVSQAQTSDCRECGDQWPCEVVAGMTVGS